MGILPSTSPLTSICLDEAKGAPEWWAKALAEIQEAAVNSRFFNNIYRVIKNMFCKVLHEFSLWIHELIFIQPN